MHCIVRRAGGGSTDDDNPTARPTGHRPDSRSPRRDRVAIPVISRAANALILGLVCLRLGHRPSQQARATLTLRRLWLIPLDDASGTISCAAAPPQEMV
jgi:hypothetical protein